MSPISLPPFVEYMRLLSACYEYTSNPKCEPKHRGSTLQSCEFVRCTQPRTRAHEQLYRSSSLVQLLIYFSYTLVICIVYSLRRIMRSNWNINFYKILSSCFFNITGIKIFWRNNVKPAVNSADDFLDRLHHRLTSRLELRATAFFASWNAFFTIRWDHHFNCIPERNLS